MPKTQEILQEYGLTRDTATQYIDAITRMNQTQAAEEIGVSRDTINRYKKAFAEMNPVKRSLLIGSLMQEKLLETAATKESSDVEKMKTVTRENE